MNNRTRVLTSIAGLSATGMLAAAYFFAVHAQNAPSNTPAAEVPPEMPALAAPTQAVAAVAQPIIAVPEAAVQAVSNQPVAEPRRDTIEIQASHAQGPDYSVYETNIVSTGKLISVTLDDVPLQDVVRMFTRISQANIIATSSNLQGTVTVSLQDVEWKPALTAILDMHSLALVERAPGSSVYSIVPKPQGAPEPLVVQTFALRYASVSNVATVVATLLPQGGSVAPYPSRNSLVVRSTATAMTEIQTVIENLDRPRRQVYIEAKILELNDDAIKDLGIDWTILQGYQVGADLGWKVDQTRTWNNSVDSKVSQWDKRQNVDQVNNRYDLQNIAYQETETSYIESPPGSGVYVPQTKTTPTRTVADTIDKGKNITRDAQDSFSKNVVDVRTATLTPQHFQLILSALKQMNGVNVVSNPKIMVANEEVANIHIGENEPNIKGTVTPGQLGQANSTTFQLDPIEPYFKYGITLEVTPTINTESNITVRIFPTLSRYVRSKSAPDGNSFPVTATKTIKTLFSLESGRTAAIGGLTETDDRATEKKVPLLGDIPILGKFFFTHTHTEKHRQETIIFVTVGLADPESVTRDLGLPEETDLAHKELIRLQAEREVRKADLKAALDAATNTSAKAKSK